MEPTIILLLVLVWCCSGAVVPPRDVTRGVLPVSRTCFRIVVDVNVHERSCRATRVDQAYSGIPQNLERMEIMEGQTVCTAPAVRNKEEQLYFVEVPSSPVIDATSSLCVAASLHDGYWYNVSTGQVLSRHRAPCARCSAHHAPYSMLLQDFQFDVRLPLSVAPQLRSDPRYLLHCFNKTFFIDFSPTHYKLNRPSRHFSDYYAHNAFRTLAEVDQDLKIIHLKPLLAVGPIETQLTVVFVSSGYTEAMIDKFTADVVKIQSLLYNMYYPSLEDTFPLVRYLKFTNMFASFIASMEEGATDYSLGVVRDTSLKCVVYRDLPEVDGAIQCDPLLATCVAETSEGKPTLQPDTTLIIALVNTPVLGGKGVPSPYNVITLSNSYSVSTEKERRRFLRILAHMIGHALFGLGDEYDSGISESTQVYIPNCAAPTVQPVPWQRWQFQQGLTPDFMHLAHSNVTLQVDVPAKTPCGFSNYVRPSSECIMQTVEETLSQGQEGKEHFCVVCREHMMLTLYRLLGERTIAPTFSSVEKVPFLTNPRCPHVNEVQIFARSDPAWMHINKQLTPANGFTTTWYLQNLTLGVVLASNVTSMTMRAVRLTELCKLCNQVMVVVRDLEAQNYVLPTNVLPSMIFQSTNFSYSVRGDAASATGWTWKACKDALFSDAGIAYRGQCPEAGSCTYNFTTLDVAPSIGEVSTKEQSSWMVASVFVVLVIIFGPWGWLATYHTMFERRRVHDMGLLRLRLSTTMLETVAQNACFFFGFAMSIGSVAGVICGLKLYIILQSLSEWGLGAVLIAVLLCHAMGFCSCSGSIRRLAFPIKITLVLQMIAGVVTLILLFTISALVDIIMDPSGSTVSYLGSQWRSSVTSSPSAVCQLESQFQCTGWERSCLDFNSSIVCPSGCQANTMYATPCATVIIATIKDQFQFAFYVLRALLPVIMISVVAHIQVVRTINRLDKLADNIQKKPFANLVVPRGVKPKETMGSSVADQRALTLPLLDVAEGINHENDDVAEGSGDDADDEQEEQEIHRSESETPSEEMVPIEANADASPLAPVAHNVTFSDMQKYSSALSSTFAGSAPIQISPNGHCQTPTSRAFSVVKPFPSLPHVRYVNELKRVHCVCALPSLSAFSRLNQRFIPLSLVDFFPSQTTEAIRMERNPLCRIVFSDIDGSVVHYLKDHDIEKNPKGTYKRDSATTYVHLPTGRTVQLLAIPSKTLVGGFISQVSYERIGALRKRGTIFVFITGARTATFLARRAKGLPPMDYGVCENGGKIFDEEGQLVEEWSHRFESVAGKWQQYTQPAEGRSGALWDCYRHLLKAGWKLDGASFSTSFMINLAHSPTKNPNESVKEREEAVKALFAGGLGAQFGVHAVCNLDKVHVAPIGCDKRAAVEFLLQKLQLDRSQAAALFDDENDLEFARICRYRLVPSVAHESVQKILDTKPGFFTRTPCDGWLGTEDALQYLLGLPRSNL